jgi:hypothetical protein
MIRLSRGQTTVLALMLLVSVMVSLAAASSRVSQTQRRAPAEDEGPMFHEYRGIMIGSLADEVRKKLGSPADKSTEQDFFVLNEKETAQVLYDKTGKVTAISVDFLMGADSVLTPKQLFGGEIEAKPDGSMYKMVRYPKAGCWLSYNRTAGAQPLVTVTLQKIDR